jgi:threonine/homoserine/homoserine lactone efflux protein
MSTSPVIQIIATPRRSLKIPVLSPSLMLLDLGLPIRGVAAGFLIAAPVGPVNVLCIQRSLQKGWRAGIVSGLGAALVDTLYGAIAGFSISLIIQFLLREQTWIRLIGGILLIGIGIFYYTKPPLSLKSKKKENSDGSDLISTFLLTATNPTTILSFLAILAMLGLGSHRPLWETSLLVGGIFVGSMTWWVVLASGAHMLRDKVTDDTVRWLNRIGGIAIAAFGIVNIIFSRHHR